MFQARIPGAPAAAAVLAVFVCGAIPAQAESRFRVAAGGGPTRFETRCDGNACDRRDAGWRFAVGYAFNERWSVEALWVDAGEFIASDVTAAGTPFFGRADVSAFGATLGRTWALGRSLTLDARLGLASVEADFSPGPAPAIAGGRKVTRAMYGVTARWRLSPHWAMRLDWDGTEGRMNRFDGRVDLVTVGIQYDF